jgi:hypothetical protein
LDSRSTACRQSIIVAELGLKGPLPGKLQIGARWQATWDEVGTGDWGTGLRSNVHKRNWAEVAPPSATD